MSICFYLSISFDPQSRRGGWLSLSLSIYLAANANLWRHLWRESREKWANWLVHFITGFSHWRCHGWVRVWLLTASLVFCAACFYSGVLSLFCATCVWVHVDLFHVDQLHCCYTSFPSSLTRKIFISIFYFLPSNSGEKHTARYDK